MATRLLLPRSQVVGGDGRPVSGAKLNTYITGTSTAKAVYTDAALTIAHANPVVADDDGRFPLMFPAAGDYRLVLTDAADVVITTDDPVEGATTTEDAATATGMRNRLLNPAMQISQQRGNAAYDATNGAGYSIDGWQAQLSATPGGTLRMEHTASVTPGGSPFRLRATVQATDASIAAGDYYVIAQSVEGTAIADYRFGSASARQLLLRLGVRSSVAGTFGVSLTNSAANRSYVTTITIAPGEVDTDAIKTLTIAGDTAGTWLTTTGIGLTLRICLSGGATFQGSAGWQAGNILTTSSQTNLMATGSATFSIFDAGLYVDASAAGIFPAWELPDLADEFARCLRYYEKSYQYADVPATISSTGAWSAPTQNGLTGACGIDVRYAVRKRATPTVTTYGPGTGTTGRMVDSAATESATTQHFSGESGFRSYNSGTALLADTYATMHWVADARL